MAIGMKPGWLGYNVMPEGPTGPTPASTTIDLTPMGLLNDANNYVLQQDSVYNLLKYAWTGVLLPTSEAEYWARVPVSDDVKNQISGLLKPLLESYARASTLNMYVGGPANDPPGQRPLHDVQANDIPQHRWTCQRRV